MGLLDGFFSLGKKINKVEDGEINTNEGIVDEPIEELRLDLPDEELIKLSKQWEAKWAKFNGELKRKQEENKKYWLGKHYHKSFYLNNNRPLTDNLIFEAIETFLPLVTRQNPEPIVVSDNTDVGNKIADNVQKMLVHLADTLKLKLKIKKAVRHWSLFYLGVAKVGWDEERNDITLKIIHPQRIILDPDATIDEDGYTGRYIGEIKSEPASMVVERFKDKKSEIEKMVDEKMGTTINYIEFWTREYVFWKLNNIVLAKAKNPHWNYPVEVEEENEFGGTFTVKKEGNNHFSAPRMPYIFLSIFNIGEHPVDDTNPIEQNLALQDMINKRLRQIDKNADNLNAGIVVSGDGFTEEQAKRVADTIRNGGVVWIPKGNVREVFYRDNPPSLPSDLYNTLFDYRAELRNIFGTKGLTPQGLQEEKTVRGKILATNLDAERHGGGITEYIEQFVDDIFNWFVQLMYVYYDEPKSAAVLGDAKAKEFITLTSENFNLKLTVSVKEGSLLPQDNLSKRNEALELWNAGAIDPITLFDRLGFPDPVESAMKLLAWQTNPASLFSGQKLDINQLQSQINQPIAGEQGGAPAQPSESMLSAVPLESSGLPSKEQ